MPDRATPKVPTSARVSRREPPPPSRRRVKATSRKGFDEMARQALLAQHVGLVHHVARQLLRRLSTAANLDELVSAGALGLVQAVDSFDTGRGLSFSTFAVPRIRGAMLDELRHQDHVSRNVRRRSRELSRARETLAGSLHRAPTLMELSGQMNATADQVRQWELDAESASLASIDQPLRSDPSGATVADSIADPSAPSIEDLLSREQEVEQLKAAIARLNEQERTVLALNYFEELKLQEIATVLGLSVCRISQVRTAALAKLRATLRDLRAA